MSTYNPFIEFEEPIPPTARNAFEVHVQQEMLKKRYEQSLGMVRKHYPEILESGTMNTTAETLDATTSTFTTPEGSVTIGSVDTDRHGHQVSLRVKDNEGNEIAIFFTPELSDRFTGNMSMRASEVRNARRR